MRALEQKQREYKGYLVKVSDNLSDYQQLSDKEKGLSNMILAAKKHIEQEERDHQKEPVVKIQEDN